MLRILWGTCILCLSGFAASLCWRYSPALAHQWLGQEPTWFAVALPIVAFIVTFLLLRLIGRTLIRPLGYSNDEIATKNRNSPVRWAATLLLSLIPTALICFSGATFLRHAGSIAQIRSFASEAASQPVPHRTAFLAKLKTDIEETIPANWFRDIDPLTDDLRIKLAKLISVSEDPPPSAIRVLEVPQIRAIILADDRLRQLARDGRYAEILRDPRLDHMLENDNLREVLQGLQL